MLSDAPTRLSRLALLALAAALSACGATPPTPPDATERVVCPGCDAPAVTDACKPDPPCVADVTGYGPTCWRLRDGAVRCAGDNTRDLLGLEAGDHHHPRPTPWARYPRVDDLHVGHGFGCALLPGGAVECWGSRLYGRLGDGSTEGSRVEGAPVVGLPPVVELVGGFDFTCGRTAEGAVWCWGGDIEGEQGNGDGSDDGSDDGSGDAPTAHRLALRPARALAAGARHAC
ncbi:MAG: RCC1 domain-containing protein, partial [bacterium]